MFDVRKVYGRRREEGSPEVADFELAPCVAILADDGERKSRSFLIGPGNAPLSRTVKHRKRIYP